MANFFDQFDTKEAKGNFFDQFDSFDARYSGDAPAPVATEELSAAMRLRQSPRERGRAEGREGGYLDAIPRAITTGALGNLPDYGPAAVAGVGSLIRGEGFGKGYSDELEVQRGQREGLAEKYPGTTLGGILTGAIAPFAKVAKMINAPTWGGRAAQSIGVGVPIGYAQGFASGEGFEDRAAKGAQGALISAVVGPAAEGLVTGAGKVIGSMGARPGAPGVAAENVAAAREFNIPLTRGQATGDVRQQAYEEASRNSARGAPAAYFVRRADKEQAQAIEAAKGGILPSRTMEEAGEAIAKGVKDRAASYRTGADEAYGSASTKGASIASDEVGNLGRRVAAKLEADGIQLDTYGNYPGAQAAMNLLRRVSGFEGAQGKVVAQSLDGLEQARQGLNRVKPGNAMDAMALKAIRRGYDDWIDDAIDRKLFSGDPSALDDILKGRELWSRYKGLTTKGTGDAMPVIKKIATEEKSGQEVANWLIGTAGVGQAGKSARVAQEIKKELGTKSEAWEALRQAAWTKISTGSNQVASKSVAEFMKTPVARALFSADEIGKMQRLAGVLGRTVTDRKAANPSGSGYEVARMVGHLIPGGAVGGAASIWSGDPKYLAIATLPLLRSATKGFAATRAVPGTGAATAVRAGAPSVPTIKRESD